MDPQSLILHSAQQLAQRTAASGRRAWGGLGVPLRRAGPTDPAAKRVARRLQLQQRKRPAGRRRIRRRLRLNGGRPLLL